MAGLTQERILKQFHSIPYRIIQNHTESDSTIENHTASYRTKQHHTESDSTRQNHEIPVVGKDGGAVPLHLLSGQDPSKASWRGNPGVVETLSDSSAVGEDGLGFFASPAEVAR